MRWSGEGWREVWPRGRAVGMCDMEGVNGWRGKGRDEPTAPDQDSEGDFRELERDRHEIKEKCKCERVLE